MHCFYEYLLSVRPSFLTKPSRHKYLIFLNFRWFEVREAITKQSTGTMETTEKEPIDDPDLKVILIGDSAVGKSKLIERFLEDEYKPQRVSIEFEMAQR